MIRLVAVLLAAAALLPGASFEQPRVKRAVISDLEKSFDKRIFKFSAAESFDLLGTTRGLYLDGYGVVFTSEVNLIVSPAITPFHLKFTKEEIARIRDRKLKQLPLLKENMRQMLVASASALKDLPGNEQVVVGVSLFYYSWEDTTGLPSQIVMQGERQKLVEEAGKQASIRMEEY